MMKKFLSAILLSLLFAVTADAGNRKNFDEGWLFLLADSSQMSAPEYNDSYWRKLDLPHDWAIEGDFSDSNPSGATGGALPGGVGWYRKHFTVSDLSAGKHYYIDFDGVYMNSTVYVNGQALGTRPYGYSSFRYELTRYLHAGDNVIAVRVDNALQPNSRWYSGCGIYRHVWLYDTQDIHVAHWGTFVKASPKEFDISVSIENHASASKVQLRNSVLDAEGRRVATSTAVVLAANGVSSHKMRLRVKKPHLWDVDSPYLYTVRTEIVKDGRVVDTYLTQTGVRTFRFDAKTGFWLNGRNIKLNGVCDHHDMGCLGAAVHHDAILRKLSMLKQMGCNAVRTSHNPPAPEYLQLCDSLGLLVMDESFDMWHRKKTQYDYAQFFDKWFESDLTDMILRDRNHPSIVVWSIGNEVLEQWSSADADTLTAEQANLILNAGHDASQLAYGAELSLQSKLTQRLVSIVKSLDTSRPVTAGCNEPSPNNHLFKSGALDIIGYNYHIADARNVPQNFPGKPFVFTESVSALQSTGFYRMPSDSLYLAPVLWWKPFTDGINKCSAYDNMRAPWGALHEESWDFVKHTPYCSGQFIWTGWDYIGEPTPYSYPARSSYFGIIDLAGFPKDVYYMYQSEWTNKPVLHLFPHWNWLPGQTVDMWCYYNNADEVELFVNGSSKGVRRKGEHDYHVCWRVVFEPGEVKVVARKQGKVVGEKSIKTAGQPHAIRLTADSTKPHANGLVFVTAEVVDAQGNLCPWAENELFFSVKGNARIVAVDNGVQTSLERFVDNKRRAANGKALVVLQVGKKAGNIELTAQAIDLKAQRKTF